MLLLAMSVATTLVVSAVPTFLRAKPTVTVSPGSTALFAGLQSSEVSDVLSNTTSGTGDENVIVKSASEMSKKMWPAASTLMRALVVAMFGSTTISDPSLGVLDYKVTGNVLPHRWRAGYSRSRHLQESRRYPPRSTSRSEVPTR